MKKLSLFVIASIMFMACNPTEKLPELEGIRINKKSIEIEVGDTYKLRVIYEPSEAEDSAPEVIWESSRSKIAKVDDNGKVTAVAVGKATITATCGKLEAECEVEVVKAVDLMEDLTNLEFEASATDRVVFSPGNLQYEPVYKTWRFAEHQYDIIGEQNAGLEEFLISGAGFGYMDLFGWGTGKDPIRVSTEVSAYGTFYEWGDNKISNNPDATYKWRTSTYEELVYIVEGRTNAEKLRGIATVNNQRGYILLSHKWTLPSGLSFTADPGDWTTNTYSISDWKKMEAAGALFLPNAGCREGTEVIQNQIGYYWTSVPNGEEGAYAIYIGVKGYGWKNYFRYSGISVRLVRDVE